MNDENINVYGIVDDSIVDGPGIRLSIFFQGCPHHCPGCHNQDSQSFIENQLLSVNEILSHITPITQGISISGGEPFAQPEALLALVKEAREQGVKSIWIWSGWTYEQLLNTVPLASEVLKHCDVLVDGPFVEDLRDTINYQWRGSSNQRLVDVRKSSLSKVVCLSDS